ncbi:hypothetical protein [Acinetobacter baumannii]|uniref:hypothetical protein n=1 Tax=Acinetobacter baumannii TaxID=470 RepID=UPI000CDE62E2|nr:hypothetical protein [Acinetobacter baumannii]MBC6790471.1 hypothetical protein [Acinetobacter baumannii]MBS4737482.1 hypothetical protein [Acinetobacter baumannii]MCH1773148.1 hypothetical protein [Acinetobacter baumannii]MCR0002431.1 hypothetical protein [Acinetobacter baumannii]POZ10942.1 hypothetical protein C3415_01205 [Acinetobacter baumannii]
MFENNPTDQSESNNLNNQPSLNRSLTNRIGNILQKTFIDPLSTKLGEFWIVTYIVVLAVSALFYLFSFIFSQLLGPEQIKTIISLNPNSLEFLNRCFNFIIYMVPAFVISAIGSYTRILLSDYSMSVIKCFKLVVGSGFFGIATLLGIQSGIFFDLLLGHLPNASQLVANNDQTSDRAFYKIIFLCFLTGMFSTVIFMTIEEKVKILSKKLNEER